MKQFGRRGKEPGPSADAPVDLTKRLEGAIIESPSRAAPPRPSTAPPETPSAPAEPSTSAPPTGAPSVGAPTGGGPVGRAAPDAVVPPPDPNVDRLTDLFGPAVFERLLAAESARARRYRRPTTIVLAELAGIDALARSWGLDVGIEAVTSLADVLQATSRTSDYVARIATNRFAIILTETDEIAAINYVERVREAWGAQQAIAVGALRVGIGWSGTPGRATLLEARPIAEQMLREDLGG